ncbi:MAG: glucose-1-phosphate cytidylyltransferase, partial [Eubacterium sp.]|nr:glucose-1-phosphate cytidylyltransferase [Eubacterium sp.]
KQQKGVLDVAYDNSVRSFREKKPADAPSINAGYMVMEPGVFEYLRDDDTVLETHVLSKLADEGQLMSYSHDGFWQCMDNLHEKNILERLVKSGQAPWIRW